MWSGSRGCTTWTGYFKCWEVKTGFCRNRSMQPVLLGLSLAGNPVKPLLSLYGTEWRERGYGLRQCTQWPVSGKGGIGVVKFRPTHGGGPMGPQWRHQNRLSSANVVIVRRTHKSSRRGKEGGEDPVRERVKALQEASRLSHTDEDRIQAYKIFRYTLTNTYQYRIIYNSTISTCTISSQ